MRVYHDIRRAHIHGNKNSLSFKIWGIGRLKFSRNVPELNLVLHNYENMD
jgi:hypothetical protein